MWLIRFLGITFAVLWLVAGVAMVAWRLTHLRTIPRQEKITMAYHKVGSDLDDDEAKQALLDSLPDADECGIPDDEAASDETRDLARLINAVSGHCEEIGKLLKAVPLSTSRRIAEMKLREVQMWAGQAFIDSET